MKTCQSTRRGDEHIILISLCGALRKSSAFLDYFHAHQPRKMVQIVHVITIEYDSMQ